MPVVTGLPPLFGKKNTNITRYHYQYHYQYHHHYSILTFWPIYQATRSLYSLHSHGLSYDRPYSLCNLHLSEGQHGAFTRRILNCTHIYRDRFTIAHMSEKNVSIPYTIYAPRKITYHIFCPKSQTCINLHTVVFHTNLPFYAKASARNQTGFFVTLVSLKVFDTHAQSEPHILNHL